MYNFEDKNREELIQLLQEKDKIIKKKIRSNQKSTQFRLWLVKVTTTFYIGQGLKNAFKKLVEETSKGKPSKDAIANVLAHLSWRLTRIGVFATMIALTPLFVLLYQTLLLKGQNNVLNQQYTQLERQNELIQTQSIRINQQTYLEEASRRSSLVFLMGGIMDRMYEELNSNSNLNDTLSDVLIARMAGLSQALQPYRYLDGDTLIRKELSPERGQLLISLARANLGKPVHDQVYRQVVFDKADLKNADLKNADLESIRLPYVNLNGAHLNKADLKWAELKGTDFTNAKLHGARLEDVDLRKANLNITDLRSTSFTNANLKMATLRQADLRGANLKSSNLQGADLRRAVIINCNLKDADNLTDIKLDSAVVNSKTFIKDLIAHREGKNEGLEQYYVSTDYGFLSFSLRLFSILSSEGNLSNSSLFPFKNYFRILRKEQK